MRALLIRGGLAAVAIVVFGILWLVLARPLSELVDRVRTVRVASLSPSPFTWNDTWLQFGPPIGDVEKNFVGDLTGIDPQFRMLDLTGPGPNYGNAADIAVDAHGKLVLSAGGKSFVLGVATGNLIPIQAFRDMPEYAAEPGDTASLVIEHSFFAWPTPFELNVVGMSGTATTWVRHVYYRLSWVKASGARLTMLWAGEQPYYGADNGWGAPGGFLMQVDIR
ncbi:MAG TPA: hypothetical protein VNV38_05070 [Stellaceae bacterium]|jgi:hypothetical protein|nr:hypothetical protein [Stellaceae bacterium]